MELNYEFTEYDYIKFYKYHAEYSSLHKHDYFIYKFVTPMILGVLLFILIKVVLKGTIFFSGILILFFLIVYRIRFPRKYEETIRKQALSALADSDNSSMLGKRKLILKENEIEVITENTTTIIANQVVKDRLIFDDMVLIYLSGHSAYAIPMRGLTIEEREVFLERIKLLPQNMNRNEESDKEKDKNLVYNIKILTLVLIYLINLLLYFKTENKYALLAMLVTFGAFFTTIHLKDKESS